MTIVGLDGHSNVKIYIAARFSRRPDANILARALKDRGFEIVSRWVLPDSDHVKPTGLSKQAADAERRRFAEEDIEDIENCDWLIALMEEPRSNGRGGRHVEFGYAMAMCKVLTVIGPKETVFHHLVNDHYDTASDFLENLDAALKRRE